MIRTLALTTACATLGCAFTATPARYAPDPATLYGAKAHRTAFEDPTQTAPVPTATAGPAPRDPGPNESDGAKAQRTRTGLFWAGIATTAVGAAMLTAFGIGGRATQGQLAKAYDDADLSYDREETLRDRGKVFNALAGAGAGIALVGLATAAVVYGIDYSRCGTLAKRRKDCKK